MKETTLVLNVGSSSVKFAIARRKKVILRGVIDHFGKSAGIILVSNNRSITRTAAISSLPIALRTIRRILFDHAIVPTRIAHRIVHGGTRFSKPTKLSPATLRYLHQLIDLAPLHQPANLLGVAFAKKSWPASSEWGVFDTSLYRHLPTAVQTYALPRAITERLHIHKYGFHGLSHLSAFHHAATILRKPPQEVSAVSIHLGSGASMTAWHRGQPIDTTMGFTPLEGLVMATRSGDIDPAIPLYIQQRLGWSARRVEQLLEHHAGLVGISGLKDMRDVLSAAGYKVPRWAGRRWSPVQRANAKLALDIFSYHIRRTLAGYLGLLDRPDAVIFTGPIGQNPIIQKIILTDLPAARSIRRISVSADEEQAIVDALPT